MTGLAYESRAEYPFVRLIDEVNFVKGRRSGKTYFVEDRRGRRTEIGKSVSRGTNHLVYFTSTKFMKLYENGLPLSGGCRTESFKEFETWMHKQIHTSFSAVSKSHNYVCWFMKKCDGVEDGLEITLMPKIYSSDPGIRKLNRWVLLKVGHVVFPARVINNFLEDGWIALKKRLGLTNDNVLVFGIEREWVIDVLVLNKNLDLVHSEWFDLKHKFTYFPYAFDLGSAFLPSSWIANKFICSFGHFYEDVTKLAEVLVQKLRMFIQQSREFEKITIVSGSRSWMIKKSGTTFNLDCLRVFERAAKLKVNDFLYFGVVDSQSMWVVVFDEEGDELLF